LTRKATDPSQSDEELFGRSAGGDRAAFEHLYDRYHDKLVWFARGFTQERESAEDVVQEVFITIIEKPGLFDRDKRFSTWIYTITANRCRNLLRNENNRRRLMEEQEFSAAHAVNDEALDRKLLRHKVQEAIGSLSAKEQRLCTLRFEEEQSIKDIADIMSLPEGSVKSGLFHLIKKISKQLKEFSDAKRI
jgi:RNA polymerase sigma-70 factor, ECF subfamily